jgi:hypothetical protein
MVGREDFGHKLLENIRAVKAEGTDTVLMGRLETLLCRTLGIAEEVATPVPHFLQPVRGAYPHWRIKVEGGKEVDRRPVYDASEFEALIRSDPLFLSVDSYTPVPPREG